MRLSRLYSNQPDIFAPIDFADGLNAILAEIRLPENRGKDTHNLGKSTLGRLLDFGFLSGRDAKFFLFKHAELFKGFVFFLEIELPDSSFVTVRRGVSEATKICFKRHDAPGQDYSTLAISGWDHQEIAFEPARELLDGMLDWRALRPWSYRKAMGYLLRSQADYGDVFHLRKFASGHGDWKPFLAHILGFDADLLTRHYKQEALLKSAQARVLTIQSEMGASIDDASKIEGLLQIKQKELDGRQKVLDSFDFRSPDKESTKLLVDSIDQRIAALNGERYSLSLNRKKLMLAIEDEQVAFNAEEAKRLFSEVGVFFEGQLKKDFQQLLEFNRALTDERRVYLQEELTEVDARLKVVNLELRELGKQRADSLVFLTSTDVFAKYKQLSNETIALRADIATLEMQRTSLHRLQELRTEIRSITAERNELQAQIEKNVENENANADSLFSVTRLFFNEIVEEVIGRKALLSVSPNREGHVDFRAEILNESGNSTSADDGHSYRKLLCIAFDLAVLRAHADVRFPRFVYHDGAFESLDDRKKENLLLVLRRYADFGLQPIVTLIDSDLPIRPQSTGPVFEGDEVVLTLHDEGAHGRLFRMEAW
jgi:uncharacterized protein YydD (DUF2326 family)